MKWIEIPQNLEKAIDQRQNPGPHFYYLYIQNGQIICSPMYSTAPPEIKIGQFRNSTLADGFTSSQWSKLITLTAKLLQQKGWLS